MNTTQQQQEEETVKKKPPITKTTTDDHNNNIMDIDKDEEEEKHNNNDEEEEEEICSDNNSNKLLFSQQSNNSSNTEEVEMIHEFIIQRGLNAASVVQKIISASNNGNETIIKKSPPDNHNNNNDNDLDVDVEEDNESDHLFLEQGENWLRLLAKSNHYSVLDETQQDVLVEETTTTIYHHQDNNNNKKNQIYPYILSLEALGHFLEIPSDDCFLCIDVDGYNLTIKDMRIPHSSSNNTNDDIHDDETDDDDDNDNDENKQCINIGIIRKEGGFEILPRRQLRLLKEHDRLCFYYHNTARKQQQQQQQQQQESKINIMERMMKSTNPSLVLKYGYTNSNRRSKQRQSSSSSCGENELIEEEAVSDSAAEIDDEMETSLHAKQQQQQQQQQQQPILNDKMMITQPPDQDDHQEEDEEEEISSEGQQKQTQQQFKPKRDHEDDEDHDRDETKSDVNDNKNHRKENGTHDNKDENDNESSSDDNDNKNDDGSIKQHQNNNNSKQQIVEDAAAVSKVAPPDDDDYDSDATELMQTQDETKLDNIKITTKTTPPTNPLGIIAEDEEDGEVETKGGDDDDDGSKKIETEKANASNPMNLFTQPQSEEDGSAMDVGEGEDDDKQQQQQQQQEKADEGNKEKKAKEKDEVAKIIAGLSKGDDQTAKAKDKSIVTSTNHDGDDSSATDFEKERSNDDDKEILESKTKKDSSKMEIANDEGRIEEIPKEESRVNQSRDEPENSGMVDDKKKSPEAPGNNIERGDEGEKKASDSSQKESKEEEKMAVDDDDDDDSTEATDVDGSNDLNNQQKSGQQDIQTAATPTATPAVAEVGDAERDEEGKKSALASPDHDNIKTAESYPEPKKATNKEEAGNPSQNTQIIAEMILSPGFKEETQELPVTQEATDDDYFTAAKDHSHEDRIQSSLLSDPISQTLLKETGETGGEEIEGKMTETSTQEGVGGAERPVAQVKPDEEVTQSKDKTQPDKQTTQPRDVTHPENEITQPKDKTLVEDSKDDDMPDPMATNARGDNGVIEERGTEVSAFRVANAEKRNKNLSNSESWKAKGVKAASSAVLNNKSDLEKKCASKPDDERTSKPGNSQDMVAKTKQESTADDILQPPVSKRRKTDDIEKSAGIEISSPAPEEKDSPNETGPSPRKRRRTYSSRDSPKTEARETAVTEEEVVQTGTGEAASTPAATTPRKVAANPTTRKRRTQRRGAPSPSCSQESASTKCSQGSTSTRKRTRAGPMVEDAKGSEQEIRVLATGIELTTVQKKVSFDCIVRTDNVSSLLFLESLQWKRQMIKQVGGCLLEKVADAKKVTHLIAGDRGMSIRRTPKLMIGLCRTGNIVSLDWLILSAKERRPLPTEGFLLLDDEESERQLNFNMRDTLMRSERMRSEGKSLLGTYSVYVCAGVAGNKAKKNRTPPMEEFRLIIEAAGAKWIKSLPTTKTSTTGLSSVIILVSKCEKEAKKQRKAKSVAEAVKNGATCKTTEDLFHWIMTQQFDLQG